MCLRYSVASVCCVVLAFLPTLVDGHGAALQTFQADLVRTSANGTKREVISGRLAFDASAARLVVEVLQPLHQWMRLEGTEVLVYYPVAREAFRIRSKTPATMPFFSVIWGSFKDDFDLPRLGYRMARYDKKGGTLTSVWLPPANLARYVGEATLQYDGGRLVRVEHKTAKGNLLTRSVFAGHVPFGGLSFPLEVSISYGSKTGVSEESVVYSNPRFNAPLDAAMKDFKIPPQIPVKVIDW